jgi:hypothetical protein
MTIFIRTGAPRTQKGREQEWIREYRLREADKEFARARRRAVMEMIKRAFFGRKKHGRAYHAFSPDCFSGSLDIPIDSVMGAVDWAGRDIPFLKPLSRGLIREWRRLFLSDDVEAYPLFKVRPGPGGWYLMSGTAARIAMGVLRAKGFTVFRVFPVSAEKGKIPEEENGCCAEEPKIAS